MTDLTSLIQALQEATSPSRELDARIHAASRQMTFERMDGDRAIFRNGDFKEACHTPAYTASLDAITALIERELPDELFESGNAHGFGYWARFISDVENTFATAPTEALARCIAFLSALQARGGGNG